MRWRQRIRLDRSHGSSCRKYCYAARGRSDAGVARFKQAHVNIDYHVKCGGLDYSVQPRLVRAQVELRVTGTTVAILAGDQRVVVHAYSRHGAT